MKSSRVGLMILMGRLIKMALYKYEGNSMRRGMVRAVGMAGIFALVISCGGGRNSDGTEAVAGDMGLNTNVVTDQNETSTDKVINNLNRGPQSGMPYQDGAKPSLATGDLVDPPAGTLSKIDKKVRQTKEVIEQYGSTLFWFIDLVAIRLLFLTPILSLANIKSKQ